MDEYNKRKLNALMESMTAHEFRRLHKKFFHSLVIMEVEFQKRFPKEWEEYKNELDKELE